MSMNLVAVFSDEAYNKICEFLGTNWYALAGSMVLAGGFLIHIVYSFILTLQNQKARGEQSYARSEKPKEVEFASQNMFVLGSIIAIGLIIHLSHFWAKMQFAELMGDDIVKLGGDTMHTTEGAAFIAYWFSNPVICAIYLIWLAALWFHLTHGFWSALQTIGWNNQIWFNRLKCISYLFATIICGGFACVIVVFFARHLFS